MGDGGIPFNIFAGDNPDEDPDYLGEDGESHSSNEDFGDDAHLGDDNSSEENSGEDEHVDHHPLFLDRVTFQGGAHGGPIFRFLTDLFEQNAAAQTNDHLPGVKPAEVPVLRFLRRHRGELDDYALATKKYFTASLDMLREIDRNAERTELPEELRAALMKRKASQALIHKTMAEYLDQILAERTELMELIDMVRPTTLDAFNKKWVPVIEQPERRIPIERKAPVTSCIICTDNEANAILRRSCSVNDLHFHCEEQECSCGAIMCVSCLVHHFWNQSEEGAKSYARCPHCRAEYCPLDIRIVDAAAQASAPAAKKQAAKEKTTKARPAKRARGVKGTESTVSVPAAAAESAPTARRSTQRRR